MIEIATSEDYNLKNIRQIGSPLDEEKIYMEHGTYEQIQMPRSGTRNTYVLLGHTGRLHGAYVTFVEKAILVEEMEYVQNVPSWNNKVWNTVFSKIKELEDDYVIVGWALDMQGFSVRVTPEIELIHKEHFGGMHQLLYLLDSSEKEDCFYRNKGTHLSRQNGFYLYYSSKPQTKTQECAVADPILEQKTEPSRAQYRNLYQEEKPHSPLEGNMGTAVFVVACVVLIGIIGVGIYKDLQSYQKKPETVEAGAPATEYVVPVEPLTEEETQVTTDIPSMYTVEVGDTLLAISRKFYGNEEMVEAIKHLNDIEDGDTIHVGQQLTLPN